MAKKKVLMIEDEAALQKIFNDLLTAEGYEFISALDGELGLKLVKTKKPDLILLDLIMPKVHGFDILRQIKEDIETKGIPVIILTNLEGIAEVDRAIELGATTYLVKTIYSMEEVVDKIKKALGDK